eukprot:NODE_1613_length_1101_cov_307.620459.p2 GENE.NODE_1613_length_1101_cov_307.620459~~NODE_1613_length_1101_cov_307.620459.p2  ORF type:complete len:202 (+),score=52.47 NODE_1613_length_1101_cov_307.620459:3-608(+)
MGMVAVAFLSTALPVASQMPRIATCMIALLTFVNKSTVVLSVLPLTGHSIVEDFYVAGMVVLLMLMVNHALAFGHHGCATWLDASTQAILLWLLAVYLAVKMWVKDCSSVPVGHKVSALVLAIVVLVLNVVFVLVRKRRKWKMLHPHFPHPEEATDSQAHSGEPQKVGHPHPDAKANDVQPQATPPAPPTEPARRSPENHV